MKYHVGVAVQLMSEHDVEADGYAEAKTKAIALAREAHPNADEYQVLSAIPHSKREEAA